jgi:single-strand DNA-binding protein
MAFASGCNFLMIVGTITTDIKAIEKDGKTIGCKFMVGVTRKPIPKDKQNGQQVQQTDYIPCTAWGWVAKRVLDRYQKKTPIALRGEWQSGSYIGRDGNRVYTNTCNVGEIYDFMLGTAQGGDMRHPEVAADPVADILGVSDAGAGQYQAIDPDDLPF